uniref:Tyrosine-protein phosphatase domain-containing protein n=1 Tax=Steinernema glaseri TaxID=37863 RepID=A0A1I7YK74_9BILA
MLREAFWQSKGQLNLQSVSSIASDSYISSLASPTICAQNEPGSSIRSMQAPPLSTLKNPSPYQICIMQITDVAVINGTLANGGSKLGDSPFEVSWLISTLDINDLRFKAIHKDNAILKVTAQEIGEGKGFVSKVYNCIIEFHRNHPDYEVILKVPGLDAMDKAFHGQDNPLVDQVVVLHNNESRFYSKFAHRSTLPTPEVYSTAEWIEGKQVGYCLMENMTGKGQAACMFSGLSKAQIFTMAKHIAHFQHNFLTIEDQSWRDTFSIRKMLKEAVIISFTTSLLDKAVQMKPEMLEEKIKPLYEACKNKKYQRYVLYEHCEEA